MGTVLATEVMLGGNTAKSLPRREHLLPPTCVATAHNVIHGAQLSNVEEKRTSAQVRGRGVAYHVCRSTQFISAAELSLSFDKSHACVTRKV